MEQTFCVLGLKRADKETNFGRFLRFGVLLSFSDCSICFEYFFFPLCLDAILESGMAYRGALFLVLTSSINFSCKCLSHFNGIPN